MDPDSFAAAALAAALIRGERIPNPGDLSIIDFAARIYLIVWRPFLRRGPGAIKPDQKVHDEICLFTRRGCDWAGRFPTIANAKAKLRARSFTLDSELGGAPTSFPNLRQIRELRPR
jgi:hypothetical protein